MNVKIQDLTLWLLWLFGFLSFTTLFFYFIPAVVFAQDKDISYEISDEIQISIKDMSCDYEREDVRKLSFNFEYPKLIVRENNTPTIAFIDINSDKLIFTEIVGQNLNILARIDSLDKKNYYGRRWPIVFLHQNKINLAFLKRDYSEKEGNNYHLPIYVLNTEDNRLELLREIHVPKNEDTKQLFRKRDSLFFDIYPYDQNVTKYMIVGQFIAPYFPPLWAIPGFLLSGELLHFSKNFSMIWEGDTIGQYQTIEKKGKIGTWYEVYAVSDSGVAHAAWMRSTSGGIGFSRKRDEAVVYSMNKNGTGWTEPLELYGIKDTDGAISDLEIAGDERYAFILWKVEELKKQEGGIYFAEIEDGIKKDLTKLIDWEYFKKWRGGVLSYASYSKIAIGPQGNIFVLWIRNGNPFFKPFQPEANLPTQHEMILKIRRNGRWITPIIVSRGQGNVQLPDMVIDKTGKIHITYVEGDSRENLKCYYRSLTPVSEEKK